jgi:hypothetical protein
MFSFCSFLQCNELLYLLCSVLYAFIVHTSWQLVKKGIFARKVWSPLTNQNRVKLTEMVSQKQLQLHYPQTNLKNWVNTLNNSCQTSLYIIQTRWLKCLLVTTGHVSKRFSGVIQFSFIVLPVGEGGVELSNRSVDILIALLLHFEESHHRHSRCDEGSPPF